MKLCHFLPLGPADGWQTKAHYDFELPLLPLAETATTGGFQDWTTYDFGSYGTFTTSYHTVRIVFDNDGININWWQTAGGTPVSNSVLPAANLALNRPVVASSSSGTYPVTNAVDGMTGTRWQAAGGDNEWMYVDLATTFSITNVTLMWEAAYASAYKIQVSTNATTWTDVYSTTNGNGGMDRIDVSASGRYVRMLGVKRATIYGYSLWEFEVYGQLPSPPQLNFGLSNSVTHLTWPTDYIGWRLEMQTNSTGGLGTNWLTVPGSITTNRVSIPIDPANRSAFFRLGFP